MGKLLRVWSRTLTVCSSRSIICVELKICEYDLCTESFPNSFQNLSLEIHSKSYRALKFVKTRGYPLRGRGLRSYNLICSS